MYSYKLKKTRVTKKGGRYLLETADEGLVDEIIGILDIFCDYAYKNGDYAEVHKISGLILASKKINRVLPIKKEPASVKRDKPFGNKNVTCNYSRRRRKKQHDALPR